MWQLVATFLIFFVVGDVSASYKPITLVYNVSWGNISLAKSQLDYEFGKDDAKKKSANLNIYLLMTNVFNTLNITDVYRATGNAGDDGYLNAARFQTSISTQNNKEAFSEKFERRLFL